MRYLILAIIIAASYFLLVSQRVEQRVFNKTFQPSANFDYETKVALPTLTVDGIFTVDHSPVQKLPSQKLRTLIVTGDVIPARSVNFQTVQRNDYSWPFAKTYQLLKEGDLAFINLESPLIDRCPVTQGGMIFCGDSRHLNGLLSTGVDLVNLANNHSSNYGIDGINQTAALLKQEQIGVTGMKDNLVAKEVKGLKFAFLGYNDIGSTPDYLSAANEEKIRQEIVQAKKVADLVIVAFHWGVEYTSQPSERQRVLAHLAIDNGADLIIGNHPHWIQPVEIYQGKVITYAHGNFIFDQMWSEKTKLGVVGKYTFYDRQLVDVEFFPVKIENYGQPSFLQGEQKQQILQEMAMESRKLL